MTPPTQKIEAVERKVREVCPELMELSKGYQFMRPKKSCGLPIKNRKTGEVEMLLCELVTDADRGAYNYTVGGRIEMDYGEFRCDSDTPTEFYSLNHDDIAIGHPIHLDTAREIIPKELWGELIEKWKRGTLKDQDEVLITWMHQHMI